MSDTAGDTGSVVAYAPDLMDRSRISSALPDVEFVARVDELAARAAGARLVFVDLARPGVLDAIGEIDAPVIGFGSHVDDALLDAGRAAGCAEVLPRSRFFRRIAELAQQSARTIRPEPGN